MVRRSGKSGKSGKGSDLMPDKKQRVAEKIRAGMRRKLSFVSHVEDYTTSDAQEQVRACVCGFRVYWIVVLRTSSIRKILLILRSVTPHRPASCVLSTTPLPFFFSAYSSQKETQGLRVRAGEGTSSLEIAYQVLEFFGSKGILRKETPGIAKFE